MTEARFTSSAKGLSDALSAYRRQRSAFFKSWAAAMRKISSSLVPGVKDTSRAKQLEMYAGNVDEQRVFTSTHTS